MMASLRHRLVVLAMPKCASSALEAALAPHMDVVVQGLPAAKHTPYRKYHRFLKKYFEGYSDGPMETLCLFREPLDWLNSWWRYRGRAGVPNPKRSTREMTFDAFVNLYLDAGGPPADLGRQSKFISDAQGTISVDHLFRYEEIDKAIGFIANRMDLDISLDCLNVSPPAHADEALTRDTRKRAHEILALDFEIYASLAKD